MKDSYGREWSLGFENFERGTLYMADAIDNFTRNVQSTSNACVLDNLNSNDKAYVDLKDGTIQFCDGTKLFTNLCNNSTPVSNKQPSSLFNTAIKLHFRVGDMKLKIGGLMRMG